ncbi:MAG TPA: hypothetical protein VK447_08205 [Myxococcaceae bacterium]|nr:hypothetical protein [Myxococcaceae bacterium]
MRFSPWTYGDLPHVSLKVITDGQINVVSAGLTIMYLYPERSRILSACFVATLTPDQLRRAVATVRDAQPGLNSWVVPALEFNYGWRDVREDPELSRVVLDLLASCRDLPVAKRWKQVRAQYFANCGIAPPEIPAAKKSRATGTSAPHSRGTARKSSGNRR